MSDEQRPEASQRPVAEPKEPLSERRPLIQEDDYYNEPLCPCEQSDPENRSEYDVAGDWVTYDGPINEGIFDGASLHASQDLEAQMRAYFHSAPPPPPGNFAPAIPDSPEDENAANDKWTAVMVEIDEDPTAPADLKQAAREAREAVRLRYEQQRARREEAQAREREEEERHAAASAVKDQEFEKDSSSSSDGEAASGSSDAEAPQANDGGAAQAEELEADREVAAIDEVANE